jgi:hypothetical protein
MRQSCLDRGGLRKNLTLEKAHQSQARFDAFFPAGRLLFCRRDADAGFEHDSGKRGRKIMPRTKPAAGDAAADQAASLSRSLRRGMTGA